MQISKTTFDILKNFTEINENIIIKPGNKLSTISVMKTAVAEAEVEETFDREFAIYDLNSFLSLLSLYDDPELTLHEDYLTVSKGKSTSKFWYAEPSLVVSPTKSVVMPSEEVKVRITLSQYTDVLKASNIMQLPDIGLVSDGVTISLVATDKKNDTSNRFDVEVADAEGIKFSFYFKRDNLRMIPGEYDLTISAQRISHWQNVNRDIQYWIALETDSVYEG